MAASGSQAPQKRNRGWVPGQKGKPPFINKRTHGGTVRGRGGKRGWPGQQNQAFAGSTREGQGFALWRKQKVQLDYKKLLRKQKKHIRPKDDLYAERYPEHLKHLYLAEEERLKNEERKRKREMESSRAEMESSRAEMESSRAEMESSRAEMESSRAEMESSRAEEESSRAHKRQEEIVIKKSFKKKTALKKAKEEYERVQRERQKKREEAEEKRKKIEEARALYKKKKMEAYKVLSTKTKKGQPNFNVQMEFLLKKIQSKT